MFRFEQAVSFSTDFIPNKIQNKFERVPKKVKNMRFVRLLKT